MRPGLGASGSSKDDKHERLTRWREPLVPVAHCVFFAKLSAKNFSTS